MRKKLTARQQLFVHEYLVDLNAAAAYRRAGYSKKTAETCGPRLLRSAQVAAAVNKVIKKRIDNLIMTREEVLQELSIIGRSDLRNHIDINEDTGAIRAKAFDEMPGNSSRALEMIREDRMIREDSKGKDSIINEKVTFKLHSKTAALESLAKHHGLYEKDNAQLFPANLTFRFVYADSKKGKDKE